MSTGASEVWSMNQKLGGNLLINAKLMPIAMKKNHERYAVCRLLEKGSYSMVNALGLFI